MPRNDKPTGWEMLIVWSSAITISLFSWWAVWEILK